MKGTSYATVSGRRPKILVSEPAPLSSEAEAILRTLGTVTYCGPTLSDLRVAARSADVMWVRLKHYIDDTVFSSNTQYVVSPTTGLNHIDVSAAKRLGIRILSLKGEGEFLRTVTATAEHTIVLLLSALRHVPAAYEHVLQGGWDRTKFIGTELYGKSVGIVGFGRLGSIVAAYLHAMGTQILAYDILKVTGPNYVEFVDLAKLLARADIVTLHANYTNESRHFFGVEHFRAMKKGAVFVNTARGELVDEAALLSSLKSKHIAAAALDVLESEQTKSLAMHPLVQFAQKNSNLIITPHIGGLTTDSVKKTEVFMARKLSDSLSSI